MSDATTKVWTVRELLAWSRGWFDQKGVDSARLTGELLLAHVLDVPRIKLYVDIDRPLDKAELARFRDLVTRRAKGEPTQYLVGTQGFYGRTFRVDRRALIPRPETELVAERVLRHFPKVPLVPPEPEPEAVPDRELSDDETTDAAPAPKAPPPPAELPPIRLADVGTGSGALGLTLAAERPNATVVLTDISPEAAALASANAELLNVSGRIEIRIGSLAEPLGDELFDAVVANLPYIPEGQRDTLAVHIREHEPHLALFSGGDGLDLIRAFVPSVAKNVKRGGLLVLEHGEDQGAVLPTLFDPALWEPATVERDLAGLDRFTWAIRR